jgi:type I restriction enzyme S subunit
MMEWQAVKLKDCSEIFPGYAFDSASFTENESDIPLVKGENLHQGYIDWNAAKKWPIYDWSKLERFQLKSNDIVLAMDRPWIEAGLKWSWMKPVYPKALLVQRVASTPFTN